MTRSERIALAGLVTFFAAAYILYGLFRHWSFHSSYDMAILDQIVWHLARFEAPASSIKGLANSFGDHFRPIIALFAPAYWLAPGPESLIVGQGVLFAAAIAPMFVFLRRRLPMGPSVALCAAYGFFWGIQHAAAFDVHEVAFAPLIIAWAVLALDTQRWVSFWAAMIALMLVKEDMIPVAGFFGLVLMTRGRWRQGSLLIALSLLVFVAVMRWLIPWLSGASSPYLGLYTDLLQRPWLAPVALVTPPGKLMAVLLWLAPFAFLSLASPLLLLAVPIALTLLLPTGAAYWGISFHHAAPLAAILALSAGDGLARLARHVRTPLARRRLLGWATGVSVVLSAILPGNQPFWDLFSFEHYRRHPDRPIWSEMAALIPADASVVAQAALLPQLSHRQTLYLLEEKAVDAEFVAATSRLGPWPASGHEELVTWIDARRRGGYRPIFEREGWVLLRRIGSSSNPSSQQPGQQTIALVP
jgi:uncharacterized membrane protein